MTWNLEFLDALKLDQHFTFVCLCVCFVIVVENN